MGKENKSQAGVGFLIHKDLAGNIVQFKGKSDRTAMIVVRLNSKYSVKVIQVYAPTSAYEDEVVEQMYEEINQLMDETPTHYTMVMGDFNAKIGVRRTDEDKIMGRYGVGERNERGDRLVEFAASRNLYISNNKFRKKAGRKWTWRSPDGNTKNEIDFILTNRKDALEDVSVINRVNKYSDH